MIGRTAAAPILFDAFARSGHVAQPLPPAPKGAIFGPTVRLPRPMQRFGSGEEGASHGPRILFPPNGARLELAMREGKAEPLALKIGGGAEPFTVMVNGSPVGAPGARRVIFFDPDGPGFARVTVVDGNGRSDSVMVRLQ
jgi:penicillin-binding protein 1C